MSGPIRSPRMALFAMLVVSGIVAPRADAFGCARPGYRGLGNSYNAGSYYRGPSFIRGAGYIQSGTYATAGTILVPTYYPAGGYELSDEDLYDGAKKKGDRLMRRDQYSKAAREYSNAARRATTAWGRKSSQANAARKLATQAQAKFDRYGDARRGRDFGRAKDKGDRLLARGQYQRAVAQYQDALERAHTEEQAKLASALMVKAQRATSGQGPARVARRNESALERQGDSALGAARYQDAIEAYAAALTTARRKHGARSSKVATLTQKLTRATTQMASASSQPVD